jgi:hypothetical protein
MKDRLRYYILDAEDRVVRADLITWARWFEYANRHVGYTQITSECLVSTVFLGLDHRFSGNGPPLLFETIIFGGPLDQAQNRYSSWDDAEAGHKAAVRKARAAIGQKVENDKEPNG